MEANDVADAVGGLSISDKFDDEGPSTPRAGTPLAVVQADTEDIGYDSDASDDTIRASSMSKSKSADTLRSPSMLKDDVFTSSSSDAEPSDTNAVVLQGDQSVDAGSNAQQFTPRADRGTEINEYNAQGQLPPEAAIFCANLSNHLEPGELAQHVHRAFDTYGKCYVSVKYDKHHNPYAVIQYETATAARDALRNGNYTMLDGRQVRLEQSKGDRAVIITLMAGGGTVTEHEAREMLSRFGEIETIMSTDMIPGRSTSLPRGQYVRFAFFLDCRDALRRLHEFTSEHRIQIAAGLEPKRRIGPAGSEIYTSIGPARNNTDSKSIYVGNLPEECSDNDVHIAFSRFGTVENINLVRKSYPGGALNCFAFVEFASPLDAENAHQSELWIKGNKLRIEPKEYTARRNQRMAFESPPQQNNDNGRWPATPPSQRRVHGGGWRRNDGGGMQQQSSPGPGRIPFRISPAASAALQERLSDNNTHNNAITGPAEYGSPPPPPVMMSPPPRYNPYGVVPGGAGHGVAPGPYYPGYAQGGPQGYAQGGPQGYAEGPPQGYPQGPPQGYPLAPPPHGYGQGYPEYPPYEGSPRHGQQ